MNLFIRTEAFSSWLKDMRDRVGKARVVARLNSAQHGNFEDYKNLGGGLFEMRVDYGPGYRIYYSRSGLETYILLAGGDKSGQEKDIEQARKLLKEIKEQGNGRIETA